jgi:hypothetical protein
LLGSLCSSSVAHHKVPIDLDPELQQDGCSTVDDEFIWHSRCTGTELIATRRRSYQLAAE